MFDDLLVEDNPSDDTMKTEDIFIDDNLFDDTDQKDIKKVFEDVPQNTNVGPNEPLKK